MSDHLFEPWSKLITIVVRGKLLQVPENNLLLRQLSFVGPDIASGKYCWNGECRYCEIEYRRAPGAPVVPALSCRMKGFEGMEVTKIAFEIKYNLGEALTGAPNAPAASTTAEPRK
jgi:hypothetical protein